MNTKDQGCVVNSNLRKHGKVLGVLLHQQQQQQQQNKKQGRRRLHTTTTTRPTCQEKLLNMAEARKEIVTALKFHRAAMKQVTEQRQHQQKHQQPQQEEKPLDSLLQLPSHDDSSFEGQDGISKSCTKNNFSNCMDYENDISCSTFTHPPNHNTIAPPPPPSSSPPIVTNNQTLELNLNLNLHDFKNLDDDDDGTLFLNNNNYNNNSSSSSLVVDKIESSATTTTKVISEGSLHAAVDDEGMAEMRSIGEQYQMEWNDTMNLVTSARWSNFLNNMEQFGAIVAPQFKSTTTQQHHHDHVLDELIIEFPPANWLN